MAVSATDRNQMVPRENSHGFSVFIHLTLLLLTVPLGCHHRLSMCHARYPFHVSMSNAGR